MICSLKRYISCVIIIIIFLLLPGNLRWKAIPVLGRGTGLADSIPLNSCHPCHSSLSIKNYPRAKGILSERVLRLLKSDLELGPNDPNLIYRYRSSGGKKSNNVNERETQNAMTQKSLERNQISASSLSEDLPPVYRTLGVTIRLSYTWGYNCAVCLALT